MKPARAALAAASVVALGAPFLGNLLFYASVDRYSWLIRQPGICRYLGSHVFLLNISVGAALLVMCTVGLLLATRTRGAMAIPRGGIAVGVALVVGAALAALALPDAVIGRIFGCGV